MKTGKPLIHFVAEPELIKEIDDFRFAQRFTSRAAAIKWLIRWGLQHSQKDTTAYRSANSGLS